MCNPVFDLVKYKLCFKNKPLKIPLPTEQIITKYASYLRIASIDLVYPSTLTNNKSYRLQYGQSTTSLASKCRPKQH